MMQGARLILHTLHGTMYVKIAMMRNFVIFWIGSIHMWRRQLPKQFNSRLQDLLVMRSSIENAPIKADSYILRKPFSTIESCKICYYAIGIQAVDNVFHYVFLSTILERGTSHSSLESNLQSVYGSEKV